MLSFPGRIMDETYRTTIAIADELALVREGIACICERTDSYRVIDQSADGATAYASIERLRPDLALLACSLPKLYSLEIIRKGRESGLPTRFLLLSARADRKLALEALRCGANGFVLKSAPSRVLLEALGHVAAGGIFVSPELEFAKLLANQRNEQSSDPLDSLSSREYQVFSMLIDGFRAKEIAARLDLSPKTVDTYRASLMRKLDIHDVAGLVKFAVQREITSVA